LLEEEEDLNTGLSPCRAGELPFPLLEEEEDLNTGLSPCRAGDLPFPLLEEEEDLLIMIQKLIVVGPEHRF
jgi:hypothetical protein